ncbi:hypothetical protein DFS34DRAFT_613979 [Phlyctochytrium arcticum]|nr:hypothetical protein DFS34DRAFT_613979 [Phlyctochytrium arcticum]
MATYCEELKTLKKDIVKYLQGMNPNRKAWRKWEKRWCSDSYTSSDMWNDIAEDFDPNPLAEEQRQLFILCGQGLQGSLTREKLEAFQKQIFNSAISICVDPTIAKTAAKEILTVLGKQHCVPLPKNAKNYAKEEAARLQLVEMKAKIHKLAVSMSDDVGALDELEKELRNDENMRCKDFAETFSDLAPGTVLCNIKNSLISIMGKKGTLVIESSSEEEGDSEDEY